MVLALRGKEGGGKSALGELLARLLGKQATKIGRRDDLTGRFNDHLLNKSFVLVEEAFFAGDPTINGTLKFMVNSPQITVEAKYLSSVTVKNTLHLMFTTNEAWAVPASTESRRYCVLDVKGFDSNEAGWAYFEPIHEELRNGGYEAALHGLLNRDLSGFNIAMFPVTEALRDQRVYQLNTFQTWLIAACEAGDLLADKGGDVYFQDGWTHLPKQLVHESYSRYARKHGDRHPMNNIAFGRKMASIAGIKTKVKGWTNPVSKARVDTYELPTPTTCERHSATFGRYRSSPGAAHTGGLAAGAPKGPWAPGGLAACCRGPQAVRGPTLPHHPGQPVRIPANALATQMPSSSSLFFLVEDVGDVGDALRVLKAREERMRKGCWAELRLPRQYATGWAAARKHCPG